MKITTAAIVDKFFHVDTEKIFKLIRLILAILTGQLISQLINAASGLILIRYLTLENYAKYNIIFSAQVVLDLLIDFGLIATLIPLIGDRINNKQVVGGYIKGVKYLRRKLYGWSALVAAVFFVLITHNHEFNLNSLWVCFLLILGAAFAKSQTALYTVPLLIHNKVKVNYAIMNSCSLVRLVLTCVLYWIDMMSIELLFATHLLLQLIQLYITHRVAYSYTEEPQKADPAIVKSLLSFIKPVVPGLIFNVLQSQFIVLMASWFAQTRTIAEVSAVGRLGYLITMLAVLINQLVVPYFSRLPESRLLVRFSLITVSITIILAIINGLLFNWPNLFVYVLGSAYAEASRLASIAILCATINLVATLIQSISGSRRWVYRWSTWLYIGTITLVQLWFVYLGKMSTSTGIMQYALTVAIANLILQIIHFYYGYNKGSKVIAY